MISIIRRYTILYCSIENRFIIKKIRRSFSYKVERDTMGGGGSILVPICPLDIDLFMSDVFFEKKKNKNLIFLIFKINLQLVILEYLQQNFPNFYQQDA